MAPPAAAPKRKIPVIRPSYFPYVPPYLNFCNHDEEGEQLPTDIKKFMKWRLSPITPVVIRKTVSSTGE
jgi:tubulin polyglutamylase TTLL4